jgi:hypothetical protein
MHPSPVYAVWSITNYYRRNNGIYLIVLGVYNCWYGADARGQWTVRIGGGMSADHFQIAAARAERSYPPAGWRRLESTERCNAIYRELRRLDTEALWEEETIRPLVLADQRR